MIWGSWVAKPDFLEGTWAGQRTRSLGQFGLTFPGILMTISFSFLHHFCWIKDNCKAHPLDFNWLKEIWKMHEPIWNGLNWKSVDFWCMLGHGSFQVLVYFWFNHIRIHLHMLGTNWTPHMLAKKGQTRCIPRASLILTFWPKWETFHSRKSVPCAKEDSSPHHVFFTHSRSPFVAQNDCKHCLNTKQNANGHHTCFGLTETWFFPSNGSQLELPL